MTSTTVDKIFTHPLHFLHLWTKAQSFENEEDDNNVYNDGDYSEPEVIDHIKDAFKANSEYIKSDKMYFDFRNLSVSEEHYLICLKKTIKEFQKQESDLPEVITWFPPDMSTKSALFAFLLS